MPQRLKLTVAYDGSCFAGWQSQKHGNTVQDVLERAFGRIAGHAVGVQGAGRTDSGVHALAQCAHVDVEPGRMEPARWLAAVNSALPPQLRLTGCRPVKADFHARFSARGKIYRYRIWCGPILPPLEFGRAWHLRRQLDRNLMETQPRISLGGMTSPASPPFAVGQTVTQSGLSRRFRCEGAAFFGLSSSRATVFFT